MANRFSIDSDVTRMVSVTETGVGTAPSARCPKTFLRCVNQQIRFVFFLIMVAGPFSGVESARSAPFPVRGYHTAVWTGNEMIVWGGFNGSYLKDGARYNPAANRWTAVAPNVLSTRFSHAAVWTGNEMIIWGGG